MPLRSALTVAVLIAATVVTPSAQTRPAPTPAATPAAPVVTPPPGYVIGPEDVLGILFWREVEMNGDVAVRPDGRISVPLIGEVVAAGQTPEALRDQIQAASVKYMTAASVTVVVRQINSRKVFITGKVTTPGTYTLAGPRTVMQIIALAGGLNEYADAKNITVIRTMPSGKPKSYPFNYRDVAKGKKLEQNILLEPGDTIVVP